MKRRSESLPEFKNGLIIHLRRDLQRKYSTSAIVANWNEPKHLFVWQ